MNRITTEELTPGLFELFYGNKNIGHAIKDIDGYFYYQANKEKGYWSPYSLRLIADCLDELNKPHEEQINEYFKKENE
jgi:hypothetical protein